MKFSIVTMGVAALAVGLWVTSAEAKAHKTEHPSHAGAFVSTSAGKLVMVGRNGKDHTYPLAKDVKVMINGKAGALDALKKGTPISVTMDKSGNVTAISTVTAKPTVTATPVKTPAPVAKPATAAPVTAKTVQ
jgi:septal ring-binding cell division protein DamX